MRVRVFSQVGPAHHGAMPRPSVVRSRVSESELSEIVGDELAKDGDAGFERDDERDVAEDAEAGRDERQLTLRVGRGTGGTARVVRVASETTSEQRRRRSLNSSSLTGRVGSARGFSIRFRLETLVLEAV